MCPGSESSIPEEKSALAPEGTGPSVRENCSKRKESALTKGAGLTCGKFDGKIRNYLILGERKKWMAIPEWMAPDPCREELYIHSNTERKHKEVDYG
jgi:hypothetical protein